MSVASLPVTRQQEGLFYCFMVISQKYNLKQYLTSKLSRKYVSLYVYSKVAEQQALCAHRSAVVLESVCIRLGSH